MRALCLLPVALAACGSDAYYIVVTVEARPAVHDAATLEVTASNAGTDVTKEFSVTGVTFPTSFSIEPGSRSGDLQLAIEAIDENGLLVGRGSAQSTIDAPNTTITIDSTDFVVNTDFAGSQTLSSYILANGFQLASDADGNWMVAFNEACSGPCNVFGRRFDTTGRPLSSRIAASTNAFPLSSRLTTFFSVPAVAASGDTTIAVWNHDDPNQTLMYSIECRAFDAMGGAAATQQLVASDEDPDLVSATPLSNGNFALAWDGQVTNNVIRGAVVKPDCTTVNLPQVISTDQGTGLGPAGSAVAASGDRVMYVWRLDGSVRARIASNANALLTNELMIAAKSATEEVEHVRIAPLSGGNFGVFLRWGQVTGTGASRLEMVRTNNMGQIVGTPVLISNRTGADIASAQSFGVASRPDGSVLVVWHACADAGDGSDCGVFGRLVGPSGQPVGAEFSLATTTLGRQEAPSAVALPDGAFATAWTDRSMTSPDSAGASVRARIVYPDGSGGSTQ